MLRKLTAVLLLVLTMIVVQVAWADGGELTSGIPATGEISQTGEQDIYTYRGRIGELVEVIVTAAPGSLLDSFLEIYDPSGFLIGQNDDINQVEGNKNSQLRVSLPYDGEYQIVVRGFARSSTGAYEVLLNSITAVDPTNITPTPPPNTPPTASGQLTLNEGVTADLSFGENVAWTFTPRENQNVQISMTSEAFDTYLEVYNSAGELIAYDDDGGSDFNSQIYFLPVEAGETYEIWAQSYSDDGEGEYHLLISAAPSLSELPSLTYGATVEGEVTAGELTAFVFQGSAGQEVTVQMTGNFDAVLELRNGSSSLVAADDDSGGDYLPYLTGVVLPEDGTYFLLVSGYNTEAVGSFTLTLSEGDFSSLPDQILEFDVPFEGTLSGGQSANFTFSAEAGEVITIDATAAFDSVLELYDPNGEYLTYDDDSGGDFNPRLDSYPLTTSGQYRVVLRGFAASAGGDFTITLTRSSATSATIEQPIAYGETAQGELAANSVARFSFEAQADETISVIVDSDIDLVLQLTDSTGRVVASDDDSGGNRQPLLDSVVLSEAGTYYLNLRGYSNIDAGAFSITLVQGSPTAVVTTSAASTIAYGATVEGALEPGSDASFVFTAAAGDVISASAVSEYDGYLELYDANGERVASDDDSGEGFNPLLQDITLTDGGEYRLVFSSFGGQGQGAFTLTLNSGSSAVIPTEVPPTPESTETPVTPQTAKQLTPGTPTTETLAQGGVATFTFEGVAGEQFTLAAFPTDLTSSLDLFLEVVDPSGAVFNTNDDGGWRVNPALVGLILPQDGTYTVNVREFLGSPGEFVLYLELGSLYIASDGRPARPMQFANGVFEFAGTLAANETILYSFTAEAGETFAVNSNALVEIYSADGTDYIVESSVTLDNAGTYLLVIYAPEGGATTLQLIQQDGTSLTVVEPYTSAGGALLADAPIQGELQAGETQQWSFTPLRSGEYSFVLNSEDTAGRYDPYIRVLDVNGTVLAEDDDSGGSFNALIPSLTLKGGEAITVEVTSFANQVGGAFFLSAVTKTVAEVPNIEGGELTDTATVTLEEAGQQAEFTFTPAEAGTFTLTVEGLTLPYVELYSESGDLVGRGAAVLEAVKLEPGTYRVVVFDRLNRTGEFILTVTNTEE